jgi:hypothetical protein
MKLARYGEPRSEQPAMVDCDGRLRDASAFLPDIDVDAIARLAGINPDTMPLMPGDLIATVTPAGVDAGRKPEPRFLRDGDVITLSVDGLGRQRQCIRSAN